MTTTWHASVETWVKDGLWHVRVSRNAAGPLIAARQVLQVLLDARNDDSVHRDRWMHPVRVEELDTDATYVWREGETES